MTDSEYNKVLEALDQQSSVEELNLVVESALDKGDIASYIFAVSTLMARGEEYDDTGLKAVLDSHNMPHAYYLMHGTKCENEYTYEALYAEAKRIGALVETSPTSVIANYILSLGYDMGRVYLEDNFDHIYKAAGNIIKARCDYPRKSLDLAYWYHLVVKKIEGRNDEQSRILSEEADDVVLTVCCEGIANKLPRRNEPIRYDIIDKIMHYSKCGMDGELARKAARGPMLDIINMSNPRYSLCTGVIGNYTKAGEGKVDFRLTAHLRAKESDTIELSFVSEKDSIVKGKDSVIRVVKVYFDLKINGVDYHYCFDLQCVPCDVDAERIDAVTTMNILSRRQDGVYSVFDFGGTIEMSESK